MASLPPSAFDPENQGCWAGFKSFISRGFSLIIAIANTIGVVVMASGVIAHLAELKQFKRTEIAHATAAFSAILSTLFLFYIPFVNEISWFFLQVESVFILIALSLVGLSLGLLGQVIQNCVTQKGVQINNQLDVRTFCNHDGAVFAGGVILVVTLCLALSDVQRQLIRKVKTNATMNRHRFNEMESPRNIY